MTAFHAPQAITTGNGPALPPVFISPAWFLDAACAHTPVPDIWFPASHGRNANDERSKPNERPAIELCALCPVAAQCLAYAIEHGERHGIWGGLNTRQRRLVAAGKRPAVVPVARVCAWPPCTVTLSVFGHKATRWCSEEHHQLDLPRRHREAS